MNETHSEAGADKGRTCPQCGAVLDQTDRFCRSCGLELHPDKEAITALIELILPDRIDAALKSRLREQKVIEVETAELLAERAIKWLKALGFLLGVPVLLFVGSLSFIGVKTWSDLQSVAEKTAELQKNLTEPAQKLAQSTRQIAQLQIDLDTAKKSLGDQVSQQIAQLQQDAENARKGLTEKITAVGKRQDDLEAQFRASSEAFVDAFRVEGRIDSEKLSSSASQLAALVQSSSGETRVRYLLQLGTMQRLVSDFSQAIATLGQAVDGAESLGLRDVIFQASLQLAHAHIARSDFDAGATAFQRAVDAVGEKPTTKQIAALAEYAAQVEIGRGETEAGLIDALRAVNFSADPKDRFYAELDLADGLQKLAESCVYRPLTDAKTSEDGADTYAACRRAVAASKKGYERAATIAASLGWTHLVNEIRNFQSNLDIRRQLIDQRAKADPISSAAAFHPSSIRNVLVTRQFEVGASAVADTRVLANLVKSVAADADAQRGHPDSASLQLRQLTKDIGDAPDKAAKLYDEAAGFLGAERRGFFNLRQRGTVIDNRSEIVRDLALHLLALGREAGAFAAFEAVRSRGLGELASVLARSDVTAEDRAWLADLLVLEARARATEHKVVAEIVASGQLDTSGEMLRALDDLRADRIALLRAHEASRARFAGDAIAPPASLEGLHAAATRAGIPVLLYWTTSRNVIAWYVGPDGTEVRNVFLPASVLNEKIGRVLTTSGGSLGKQPFDEVTARELFLFLVAPFAARLDSVKQIMIVPQGPLGRLPFEALIDPVSGASVIDHWAVSYAPNATMAVAALQREVRPVRTVVALVDPTIDNSTKEIAQIRGSGAQVREVQRTELFRGSWQADSLHALTHCVIDPNEALLSSLTVTRSTDPPVPAAQLLTLPLQGLPLAVLSDCKGGQVGTPISGETYGFPWALLASGVAATVLSRWDVSEESHGRWMGMFYQELAGGASAAKAAATTMREMRKAGFTHPYYWAAMQVNGR